jgi:hypothetical protein
VSCFLLFLLADVLGQMGYNRELVKKTDTNGAKAKPKRVFQKAASTSLNLL